MQVPFQQVDVFTAVPFKGNPVAVILEGNGLETEQMQSIARWTNLSETTFVCAPKRDTADYRLRIFTPQTELSFAGHPTIGSAWALLQHGIVPRTPGFLVQECGKGLITIKMREGRLSFALPEPAIVTPDRTEMEAAAEALGITSGRILAGEIVDVGAVWLTLQLESAEEVLAAEPDMQRLACASRRFTGVTVFGLCGEGSRTAVEVRSFAPAEGVPEDPVCGSGNGCVAALIRREEILRVSGYLASQGRRVGREGEVHVEYAGDGTIWLGGNAVTCIRGSLAVSRP
jgi:PhzF family phenazine biosynthesis protein